MRTRDGTPTVENRGPGGRVIVTVTFNPAVDQTVRVEEPMRPDRVLRTTDARFDAGGKGINVSRFLAAMNVETLATGFLGGFTGRYVREELREDDVPFDFVEVEGTTRLNSTIVADGEEYKVNGAGPGVDSELVGDVLAIIAAADPDRVLVSGSLPPGLDLGAIDAIASVDDWTTSVDVRGEYLRDLREVYGVCKPNRRELGSATGVDVSTLEGAAEAAHELLDLGYSRVVASLDTEGALIADADGVRFADALDVEAVDTVGAGDALLAGVLAALDAGDDVDDALRRGVAVASHAVGVPGPGVTAFDDLDERAATVEVRQL